VETSKSLVSLYLQSADLGCLMILIVARSVQSAQRPVSSGVQARIAHVKL
jgi:hypothetical protein